MEFTPEMYLKRRLGFNLLESFKKRMCHINLNTLLLKKFKIQIKSLFLNKNEFSDELKVNNYSFLE